MALFSGQWPEREENSLGTRPGDLVSLKSKNGESRDTASSFSDLEGLYGSPFALCRTPLRRLWQIRE